MKPSDLFDELYNLRIDLQHIYHPLSFYLIGALIEVMNRIEDGEDTEELLNLTVSLYWAGHHFILQHLDQVYRAEYIEEARKEHEQKLSELGKNARKNKDE